MKPHHDPPSRLQQQMEFVSEVDKLKKIERQSYITDGSRRENDAEHSWHLALMALLLHEHANGPMDDKQLLHVIKMLLVHDLVEIDAGDTFAYDEEGLKDKAEREERAAKRLFSLLPEDQRQHIDRLWREFEQRQTPAARFAAALDRLQPLMLNWHTEGRAWNKHDVRAHQVVAKNEHMEEGSAKLWEYAQALIEDAIRKGDLKE